MSAAPMQESFRPHLLAIKRLLATLRRYSERALARLRFSTFEKAILANSVIILLGTAAGWWITQHNPEAYHYVIDTTFIALVALAGVVVNFALLRAAFGPLRAVLATIRTVEEGEMDARVESVGSDPDAETLARAFNDMLDRLARARDETVARELRAQEAERRRLALELHDQTGQSLTAMALHAQAIAQRLAGETSVASRQARAQAEQLATLAERTLAETQALSHQLRPSLLDDLGLAAALRWLADDANARLGIKVCAEVDKMDVEALTKTRLPDEIETAMFRIAQESLTNAVKHGMARHATIILRQTRDSLTLTITDDGQGFDPARMGAAASHAVSMQPQGIGLAGMRERARLAGGALMICPAPEHGCQVRVSIPLGMEPSSVEVGHEAASCQRAHSPIHKQEAPV